MSRYSTTSGTAIYIYHTQYYNRCNAISAQNSVSTTLMTSFFCFDLNARASHVISFANAAAGTREEGGGRKDGEVKARKDVNQC